MLFAEGGDGVEVEDVAQSVGDHDSFDFGTVGLVEAGDVDLVSGECDVEEDGDEGDFAGWG